MSNGNENENETTVRNEAKRETNGVSDNITSFDPNRKREEFPPVPDVMKPQTPSIESMDPVTLAQMVLGKQTAISLNDATKIADRLAAGILQLNNAYQMQSVELNTMRWTLERTGNPLPGVEHDGSTKQEAKA